MPALGCAGGRIAAPGRARCDPWRRPRAPQAGQSGSRDAHAGIGEQDPIQSPAHARNISPGNAMRYVSSCRLSVCVLAGLVGALHAGPDRRGGRFRGPVRARGDPHAGLGCGKPSDRVVRSSAHLFSLAGRRDRQVGRERHQDHSQPEAADIADHDRRSREPEDARGRRRPTPIRSRLRRAPSPSGSTATNLPCMR